MTPPDPLPNAPPDVPDVPDVHDVIDELELKARWTTRTACAPPSRGLVPHSPSAAP
jgi:hypothetical protein